MQIRVLAQTARQDRQREVAPRCPFCHEEVRVEAGGWLVCALCLARHHQECWQEAARCACCGDVARLAPLQAPVRATPAARVAVRPQELALRLTGFLVWSAGVIVVLTSLPEWEVLRWWRPGTFPWGWRERAFSAAVVGLVLMGVGTGLSAVAVRWGPSPRLPWPLLSALLLLSAPLPLGLLCADAAGAAMWVALVLGGWCSVVVMVAGFLAGRASEAQLEPLVG